MLKMPALIVNVYGEHSSLFTGCHIHNPFNFLPFSVTFKLQSPQFQP